MSTARKSLLANIKAATNRAISLGLSDVVVGGLNAYHLVSTAPETVTEFRRCVRQYVDRTLPTRMAA